ncbi:CPBP family intramembrane glutamic endopeptidase [Clostridium oceanicum]|uniref:Type II CAAX endopeptidase family protein n=1 Tax=Clostridium oceanicum TaxID=1543 RepID=A0ABP3UP30_9CLOT
MFLKKTKLVCEAEKSEKFYSLFSAFFSVIAFTLMGEIIGVGILWLIGFTKINESSTMKFLGELIISNFFISLIIFRHVKKEEKRSISGLGFYKKGCIKNYLIGFTVGMLEFMLVVMLLSISGHIKIEQGFITNKIGAFLIILPAWIIQSATEEILSRGWLMNVLGARYNITIGLVVSSLFFAAMHLGNPNMNIIAFLNLFMTGIFFGLYVIKTENLWGVCGIHAAWNAFQGNFFGFEVSGLNIGVGSIMKLKSVGSPMITGGMFGPEGGLACTIVECLISIFLIYIIKKSYNKADKPLYHINKKFNSKG